MYYKLHHRRNERVPGIVVLLVIGVMVAAFSFFFTRESPQIQLKKNASGLLQRTEIANIRDNTVTLYWHTTKPTTGYILYGNSRTTLNKKMLDKQDTESLMTTRRNHVVTLDNLLSNTEYYYHIIIDGEPHGQTQRIPFQFKTTRYVKTPLNMNPIIGRVIDETGKVASNAVVLLHIGSAYPLITQTKQDGSFVISPCCIFDSATFEPLYPQKNDTIVVEVVSEQGASKRLTSVLDRIDSITAAIALHNEEEIGTALGVSDDNTVLQMAEDVVKTETIDIIFPKQNATIPGTKPLIKGVGIPGKRVKITFNPSGKMFEATISSNKVWQFQPTYDFPTGKNSLQLTTQDESDRLVTLERTFIIEKSGEAVLGDATPSATLTPETTPTEMIEPTIEPTTGPTEIVPTIVPSQPVSGINILPIGLLSVVLIVIGASMVLLF